MGDSFLICLSWSPRSEVTALALTFVPPGRCPSLGPSESRGGETHVQRAPLLKMLTTAHVESTTQSEITEL